MDQDRTLPNPVSLPMAKQRLLPDLNGGVPQRIAYIGADRRFRLANGAFVAWSGRELAEVVGRPMSEVLSADEHATALPLVEQALTGITVRHQREVLKADGGKELLEILVVPHRADGRPGRQPDGCFWIAAESLPCGGDEPQRRDQFDRDLSAVLDRVAAGVEVESVVAQLSAAVERRFPGAWVDFDLGPGLSSRVPIALPAGDGSIMSVPIVVDSGRAVGSVRGCLGPAASRCAGEAASASLLCALQSSAPIAALAIARRGLYQRLAYQSQHDELTGLPNRRMFEEHMEQLLADGRRDSARLALVVIDLDDFKRINDALGHAAGDELLRRFTARLAANTRPGDLLARVAGDEFVLLLRDLPGEIDARDIASRLCERLKVPLALGPHEVHLYASFGVSNFPADGSDVATLLRSADMAMSRAKSMGKKRVEIFTPDLQVEASDRLTLEGALRRALARNELSLHLQPQVALGTGRVVGYEALCRWTHARLGVVSPTRFIRCAEETGLIVPLGQFVLDEACRQARVLALHSQHAVRVAVNVSGAQFLNGDLVGNVKRCVRAHGLEPGQLEVELTESVLMRDTARVAAELSALRAFGVRLAIDDFGTGYSSLSYLQHLPIDALKIDQSFVRGIQAGGPHPGRPQNDGELVGSIIHLGHSLHLEVVAEGVETAHQAAWLTEAGCELAQGYWFGRPAPMATFLDARLAASS